ncbi:MAG: hypothetical protein GQF41_0790 [Candidatus Rifleibacterium amylolyticum]|nr:MAG: hypothetical protein GQF41_0790 [Candidatus Rifleibacterium amylolyticum]
MYELNDISVEAEITGDKYPKIKADLRTPLENTFWWLSVLSAVAIGVSFFISGDKRYDMQWQAVMAVAVFCLALFGSLYFNTDNYYIFDLPGKKMFYHFRFFFYKRVDLVANFADIHAVTCSGRYHSDNADNYYTYRVLCVLNDGQIIYLSDETREELEKQNRSARKIAAITGAEYVAGLPGCHAVAKQADNRLSFSFYECSWYYFTRQSALEVGASFLYVTILITIGKNGPEIIRFIKSII